MDATDRVLIEAVGTIRVITFNRPEKKNAIDQPMRQRLLDLLRTVAADAEARALVVTGAGGAFSAGGDRTLLEKAMAGALDEQEALAGLHWDTVETLVGMEIPTIAAVAGPAAGVAAGIVALCDLVVMSEDAFLWDPHVLYGLAADVMTQTVWPKLTSNAIAKELLLSGRRVYGPEAVRIGLANRLCAKGEERDAALEIARTMTELPVQGVRATKQAFKAPLLEEFARLRAATQAPPK